MIELAVWITMPHGVVALAGHLAFNDPDAQNRYASEFAYADEWLRRPDAFSLDPISLPLDARQFAGHQLEPPLGVFNDALPDAWGRSLIIRAHKLRRNQQSEPYLLQELARNSQGLGALLFAPPGEQPVPPSQPGTGGLAELLEAAIRFDSGEKLLPASMQRLFAAGSTPGGARPKVLLSDDAGDWIAKFPSPARDHRFDIVGLEKTSLDLAARAGIDVPDSRLISVGARRALLVRRFDIAGPGRHHMISLQTLCKEAPGRYAMSYSELSEAVRKVSARPQADVGKLYRRMAFNAALGNTDDHLKNFWMIRTVFGYVLSPAIDLLPDVGELHEHVLTFNYERTTPSRSDLRAIARRWNVSAGDADACINEVCKAVSGFADIARAHRVPRSNIDDFTRDVGRRCAQMGKDHM